MSFFECNLSRRGHGRRLALCLLPAIAIAVVGAAGAQVKPLDRKPIDSDGPSVESLLDETRQDNSVYAVGEATVTNGNVDSARQRALQSAYAEAVAVGAGVDVGSLTVIRNVSQITDLVTTQSRGFIRDYEIIQESIVTSGDRQVLRIEIEASVQTREATTLEDRLAGLRLFLGVLGNPKVLIVAPRFDATMPAPGVQSESQLRRSERGEDGEQVVERRSSGSASIAGQRDYEGTPNANLGPGVIRAAEASLAQALNDYGYNTYSIDSLFGRVDSELLERASKGDTQAAVAAAREAGIDIALIGRFVVAARRIAPQGVEFEQVSIEYSARATIVSTGEEVRTFSLSETQAHSNMLSARNQATANISEKVAQELAWSIPKLLANAQHAFVIEIDGIDADRALEVNGILANLEGVVNSRVLRLPTASRMSARYELATGYIKIPPTEIYRLLRSTMGASLELEEQNAFQMRLAL